MAMLWRLSCRYLRNLEESLSNYYYFDIDHSIYIYNYNLLFQHTLYHLIQYPIIYIHKTKLPYIYMNVDTDNFH